MEESVECWGREGETDEREARQLSRVFHVSFFSYILCPLLALFEYRVFGRVLTFS